jgi:membrane-associated protease RseP (regulator of RpoE activity)
MRQALTFLGLGLVAGIGLAALLGREPLPGLSPMAPTTWAEDYAGRITALEAALATEAEQRLTLEVELAELAAHIAALREVTPADSQVEGRDGDVVQERVGADRLAARIAARRERESPEYRRNELIEAGFAPDQAQWIIEREAQTRMDMLYAQYEANREGGRFNPLETELASQAALRTELGDASYARYLEATGRPTSVSVFEVLESSPGQAAGLQAGDEIVAYGGERVFNLMELNRLTLEGEPGQTVVVDVLRDGQPMQLYVPRGPIGFSGGGRGGRTGSAIFVP